MGFRRAGRELGVRKTGEHDRVGDPIIVLLRSARAISVPARSSGHLTAPIRPSPGMSEAQRVDLAAAQAGKITWAAYFAMWGPGS